MGQNKTSVSTITYKIVKNAKNNEPFVKISYMYLNDECEQEFTLDELSTVLGIKSISETVTRVVNNSVEPIFLPQEEKILIGYRIKSQYKTLSQDIKIGQLYSQVDQDMEILNCFGYNVNLYFNENEVKKNIK